MDDVVDAQLTSLDDTDCYASAWSDAVSAAKESERMVSWGGRGKGGRGLARRTFQPSTVVVEDVRLEYISDANPSLPGKLLLDGATLKLLPQHIYALIGRNGCGKSTLMRRIDAGKIPGFPPHLSSMYIPQEVIQDPDKTAMQIVLSHHDTFFQRSVEATNLQIEELENQLDSDDADQVERICEQIALLEEELEGGHDVSVVREQAEEALKFFDVDEADWNTPSRELSGGQRKKVALACAVFCRNDLLLLDEPTNYMDVDGLIQLRQLIARCQDRNTTVLMVSHDVDLINDMATDVIHFHEQNLMYYAGNYRDFVGYKNQRDLHLLRQNAALNKKRDNLIQTIQHLKTQPTPRRGGSKKSHRQIDVRKKKLEKLGLDKNEKGHRWKQQKEGTGIKKGSINSIDATSRVGQSHSQLLRRGETSVAPVPDKAVQFAFRPSNAVWGEPLVMAMDVGHGYHVDKDPKVTKVNGVEKKDAFLFDCVDLCVNEGSVVCILGENGSGKSTLLRLLANREAPLEGKIHHAQGVTIGYFDQHEADVLIENAISERVITPLSLLLKRYPDKTEQDVRGELTAFGLDPRQAATNVRFLSGGERSRLCLANLMLADPQLLIMDEPTSHLDVESVEALVYGLNQWDGTLVMVSHDANFIRSLNGKCYVILPEEGKLRSISGGIDFFLASYLLK